MYQSASASLAPAPPPLGGKTAHLVDTGFGVGGHPGLTACSPIRALPRRPAGGRLKALGQSASAILRL